MSYEKHAIRLMNQFPAIEDLRLKAKKRMPPVAWAYLETGTGEEQAIIRNRNALNAITLVPQFLKGELTQNLETTLFGRSYNFPFGIAPVGLTGLMWPKTEIFLAQTAKKYQIPYCLSTVATETPESVGPNMGEMGWFQLYPPRDFDFTKELLDRVKQAGFHTLVITADVPSPSRRERTKRAGLQMPPKITPYFIWQGLTHPTWSIETLKRGLPKLRTIESYSEFKTMMSVGSFVRSKLGGNLNWEYCQKIKDYWNGPVILKGILHPEDAQKAVEIGLNGIVVSNHGGRQFDGAPSPVQMLPEIVKQVGGKTTIIFDSGIRTGLDILRAIALGADFVLLGRAFIYGIAALGQHGGDHVVEILKADMETNMSQLGVETLEEIKNGNFVKSF